MLKNFRFSIPRWFTIVIIRCLATKVRNTASRLIHFIVRSWFLSPQTAEHLFRSGRVHTAPEKQFENAALFLRLGLPSTLIHYESGDFHLKTLFKPEKFENRALFLRLGLPSTLIRQENGAFHLKMFFKPVEFKNVGFSFPCGRKTF